MLPETPSLTVVRSMPFGATPSSVLASRPPDKDEAQLLARRRPPGCRLDQALLERPLEIRRSSGPRDRFRRRVLRLLDQRPSSRWYFEACRRWQRPDAAEERVVVEEVPEAEELRDPGLRPGPIHLRDEQESS